MLLTGVPSCPYVFFVLILVLGLWLLFFFFVSSPRLCVPLPDSHAFLCLAFAVPPALSDLL